MVQRKSGHVTLLDVARACGFSVSTVSIVLSEAPLSQNVAAATRQQIRAMAQQLGYHPDAFARSLRRRRSQTIGVLAYDLSAPYCIPIVRGIQEGLQPASYLPMVMDAQTQHQNATAIKPLQVIAKSFSRRLGISGYSVPLKPCLPFFTLRHGIDDNERRSRVTPPNRP